jgi:hypothetical protein
VQPSPAASEDLGALDTESGGVTYELTALVCLARRPAEEEEEDSPSGGKDETGAKKISGHLVSFLKVTPPYVEKKGQFAAAPYIPGMSPGVSPIPNGGARMAARAAAAAAAHAATATAGTAAASSSGAAAAAAGDVGGVGGDGGGGVDAAGGEAPTTPTKAGGAGSEGDGGGGGGGGAAPPQPSSADRAVASEIAAEAGLSLPGGVRLITWTILAVIN